MYMKKNTEIIIYILIIIFCIYKLCFCYCEKNTEIIHPSFIGY